MTIGKLEKVDFKGIISTEQEPTEKCLAMITTDPKCDYILGSKGTESDFVFGSDREVISTDRVDYNIVSEEFSKLEVESNKKEIMADSDDKRNSMSYMSVNTIEDGVDWYRKNFPKVPDELLIPMARWSFGDLSKISRRAIKNDKKRTDKGKQSKLGGLEVKSGNFVLEF